MAYFKTADSKKYYFSLFFNRATVEECHGLLLPLNKHGVRVTMLLPLISIVIGVAWFAEITIWGAYLLGASRHSYPILSNVNWIVLAVSVLAAICAALIVAISQLHAVRNKDFFHGGDNCRLQIDWLRSISIFSINLLFALNGMLVVLWSYFAPEEGVHEPVGEFDSSTFIIFAVIAAPGVLRLIWLFRLRRLDEVRWGNVARARN